MKVVKNSILYVAISGVFLLVSLFLLIFGKLNLGIDMTGGIQMDFDHQAELNITDIKKEIDAEAKAFKHNGEEVINDTSVYTVTGKKTVSVVVWFHNDIQDKELELLKEDFRKKTFNIIESYFDSIISSSCDSIILKEDFRKKTFNIIESHDEEIIESKYVNIWKSFGDFIKDTAIITLIIAIIAIAIYVTYAFSGVVSWISIWSFAIITIITLFHDVLISTGLYIATSMFLPEFKIDTFFVTALLTILGYSINDTIVVFDRIRSNLVKYAGKKGKDGKKLNEIVDLSITQTIVRSIYTSVTLLFVLLTIFFFGPETIKGFVLVMIFGTIVGTYSSVFIASPLLYLANKDKELTVYKKQVVNPEDKIVV